MHNHIKTGTKHGGEMLLIHLECQFYDLHIILEGLRMGGNRMTMTEKRGGQIEAWALD